MKTATIEELSYHLKEAKKDNLPAPIFFLGAGASKTGGVPLANEIVTDILSKYSENPKIKRLEKREKTYPKLMECLIPNERNKLLKEYINTAKINVTHIYLAQLMIHGYVDYVLTVNFDNLMLKALALFNEIPPTYDMAVLKDLTTTRFKEKSVVYLHGQHHGLWLLNTKEEMEKVRDIIPPILHSIKDKRPWVFIGYSGGDPIFDHIKNLGRFDNGLYWVTHKDSDPQSTVLKDLLDKPNTNALIIKGYDSDSFMLKLHSELKLEQPAIIAKPFYSLKSFLDNIVDIDDEKHFKGVKERLTIAKSQVDRAIEQFDMHKIETPIKIQKNTELDTLKKEIIDLIIYESYQDNKINKITDKAKTFQNDEINSLLADFYLNWGNHLGNLAKTKSGEEAEALYNLAFEKFKAGIDLGGKYYNLACTYALKPFKEKAYHYLEQSLKNKEIDVDFVKNDEDWKDYLEDDAFKQILGQ